MKFEITKNERETNQSLIRRFTKRLKESGILKGAKQRMFKKRVKSKEVMRAMTLRRIIKNKETEKQRKLGNDVTPRRF
ncbi:MAG: hypothetical protein A3C82_00210 [Candidatus Wildermuthbacteria bacterium RIFCSPHIGHO2_02_FULL_47_12]|uniref:30S ribosomal protein S21 n=1 Tax=Candidatus Wildermuthbacteria bacterium RIFCSPHIGHO2_02_FULL_47_12 TaxID=1802451 RepID=A0A1G2R599_9BACT|nr:MAG: hypothetical protein A3C82_00210 [Candidatus Wildermuthbacteria bacterium RIFCSPHIGHO2_02_FULL_47_12]